MRSLRLHGPAWTTACSDRVPNVFDTLHAAWERWVEQGWAPERMSRVEARYRTAPAALPRIRRSAALSGTRQHPKDARTSPCVNPERAHDD